MAIRTVPPALTLAIPPVRTNRLLGRPLTFQPSKYTPSSKHLHVPFDRAVSNVILEPPSALPAQARNIRPNPTVPVVPTPSVPRFLRSPISPAARAANCVSIPSTYIRPEYVKNLHAYAANLTSTPPIAASILNLDDDGNLLNWKSAIVGPNKDHWHQEDLKEFRRLLLLSSPTMCGILYDNIPQEKKSLVSYFTRQTREKPDYETQGINRRVRGCYGGDRLKGTYTDNISAATASIETVKTLFNSTISDNAQFMSLDISDYYLNTELKDHQYLKIPVKEIPTEIMDEFDLHRLVHNACVYFVVVKGMYGLPEAGILAQQGLIEHIKPHGYIQDPLVPMLFVHNVSKLSFTLVVDDFGIKFFSRESAEHLIRILRLKYKITLDWEGKHYLGMTLRWDYVRRKVFLSIPGYVAKMEKRFKHLFLNWDGRGAESPAIYVPPVRGSVTQTATPPDTSPLLPSDIAAELPQFLGCALYYTRILEVTAFPTTTHLCSDQVDPTTNFLLRCRRLLQYLVAYPDNELVYSASDMILRVQSDSSYLSRRKAGSVVGGHHCFGNRDDPFAINGCIAPVSQLLDVVAASASESEYGAIFVNMRIAENLRTIATALGHPQPPTEVYTDSSTAQKYANGLSSKASKALDMRFHWVQDRVRQGHFKVIWRAGVHNLADFFTKPLPVYKHKELMPLLVRTPFRAKPAKVVPSH